MDQQTQTSSAATELELQPQQPLENIVATTATLAAGREEGALLPQALLPLERDLLPLDEYVTRFTERYQVEKNFSDIVHTYLKLGKIQRFSLRMGKKLRPKWYEKKTSKVIQEYALRIRTELEEALQVQEELQRLRLLQQDVELKKGELVEAAQQQEQTQTAYQQVVQTEQQAVQQVVDETEKRKLEEEERKRQLLQEIQVSTDGAALIRKKLQEKVEALGLIKRDDSGALSFDGERVVERLEDLFLNEIMQEIEDQQGKNYMQKITDAYSGLISYWAEMEDLLELPAVDWVQSTIHSRSKGFRTPQFPYLITGKALPKSVTVAYRKAISTAMILDVSGSMRDNYRFQMGQKTLLAMRALMRRLDERNECKEKNEGLLGCYSNSAYSVTSEQLLREIHPGGGTRTDLALQWLLQTLRGKEPAVAYVATDGAPDNVDLAMHAAEQFRNYPGIMLRIFLIDGNKQTEENIRKIGTAAGSGTKVSSISNYQLGSGMVKDVADAIGEMQSIELF